MKLQLFQNMVEPNQSFDRILVILERLESSPFFQSDLIRHARSDVEIARVYAKHFEAIVENDAKWAFRFPRRLDEELKDRGDICDASDWKAGDFEQLQVFVRNERDRSI